MALPKFLQPFLPSYDISKMDLYDRYDKKLIIEAVLNQGTTKEIKWLFRTYDIREIKNVLRNPSRGCWNPRVLNFWTKIFNIKMPKIIYEVAIMSLIPRPKLMTRYFNYLKREGKVSKRTLELWNEVDRIERLRKKEVKKYQLNQIKK